MGEFTAKYWVTWAFGIVAAGLSGSVAILVRKYKKSQERQRSTELGVQALLRAQIIHTYNRYMRLGYVPIYERENIEELFKQYQNLGGNGTIKDLVSKLSELPTE